MMPREMDRRYTEKDLTHFALKELIERTIPTLPTHLDAISGVIPIPIDRGVSPLPATESSLARVDTPRPVVPLHSPDRLELDALSVALSGKSFKDVVLAGGLPVESILSWLRSLGASAAMGAAGGTTSLVFIALIGELGASAVFSGGTAIPVIVTFALLALVGGAVGKTYAHRYKQALQTVHAHLSKREYKQAAECLDKEFNRWLFPRAFRRPFVSKAHYAIAHLFRGMCAEGMSLEGEEEERVYNYKTAYEEYSKALADAKRTSSRPMTLLLHVQLMRLLRTHGSALFSTPQDPDALIKKHLNELNHRFEDSLTHLYQQAHCKMRSVANMCRPAQVFPDENLLLIRDALNINSLFVLDGFQGGRGNYLEVVCSFFQTLIKGYFYFNGDADTFGKLQLQSEASNPIDCTLSNLADALIRLKKVSDLYPSLVNEAAFQACSQMMRDFASKFAGISDPLCVNQEGCRLLDKVTELLGISAREFHRLASRNDQAIKLLLRIQSEFGFSFPSIEAWLEALNADPASHIGVRSHATGETMLQMLEQLPADPALIDPALVSTATERMQAALEQAVRLAGEIVRRQAGAVAPAAGAVVNLEEGVVNRAAAAAPAPAAAGVVGAASRLFAAANTPAAQAVAAQTPAAQVPPVQALAIEADVEQGLPGVRIMRV